MAKILKKTITEEIAERQEYITVRKDYIEWERNASNNLQKAIILIATGGFVYTQSFFKNNGDKISNTLLLTWWIFGVAIIASILTFYWSWKSHSIQLEIYDSEKNSCKEIFEKKLNRINYQINIAEFIWVFWVISWVILLFITFLL